MQISTALLQAHDTRLDIHQSGLSILAAYVSAGVHSSAAAT